VTIEIICSAIHLSCTSLQIHRERFRVIENSFDKNASANAE